MFGADSGATRYSPLGEIHAGNVADLAVAWRWSARDQGAPPPSGRTQISPIVVNGVLPGDVVAYDARTGRTLWRFNTIPKEGEFGVETWLQADEALWEVPTGTHDWVQERPELLDASWKYTGNVGHWAPVTADPQLGLFYVATPAPSGSPNHCRNQPTTTDSSWLGPLATSQVAALTLNPEAMKSASTPGHVGHVGTKPNDRG